MNEEITKALTTLRENSKKRNFAQTIDLIINLKQLDVKKPENRLNETLVLPCGRGRNSKVVVFSDAIKSDEFDVLGSDDIPKLGADKKSAKTLAKETDFFIAEPKLMPLIGTTLGQLLAPKGKMPALITGDIKKMVEDYKKSIRIRVKDSPVIQCLIGNENMEDEKIVENIRVVIEFLEKKLPKGKTNIANVFIKMTMSKPVKIW